MTPSSHPNRFDGIRRDYGAAEVERLSGSLRIEYTLARLGAERLWKLLQERPFVRTLGALTGNQAMQQVKAGLEAIYLSGWQVAADANNAGQMYPDQSLYPASSVPEVVKRINGTLRRADEIAKTESLKAALRHIHAAVVHLSDASVALHFAGRRIAGSRPAAAAAALCICALRRSVPGLVCANTAGERIDIMPINTVSRPAVGCNLDCIIVWPLLVGVETYDIRTQIAMCANGDMDRIPAGQARPLARAC